MSDPGMRDAGSSSQCRQLPRTIPSAPGKPVRDGARQKQGMARRIATDPASWTGPLARTVGRWFDELAANWNSQQGAYRAVPLADAPCGEAPWPGGLCLAVGAGTGLLTSLLDRFWPSVLSVDLSRGMLRRSAHPLRAVADAKNLAVASASAAAIVVADAPLLAPEYSRALALAGVIVCSNGWGSWAVLRRGGSSAVDSPAWS